MQMGLPLFFANREAVHVEPLAWFGGSSSTDMSITFGLEPFLRFFADMEIGAVQLAAMWAAESVEYPSDLDQHG